MVLNGHAGVKYGIPFPVIGRASFGTTGIHLPAIVRAIVACGWFGIQTWIGGLAIYAIFHAVTGGEPAAGLSVGKFISFAIFWFINIYFIWKGMESIKFLEQYSAPILILIGLLMIGWGANKAGGFGIVLEQSKQLEVPAVELVNENGGQYLHFNLIKSLDGTVKAEEFNLEVNGNYTNWQPLTGESLEVNFEEGADIQIAFRRQGESGYLVSSKVSPTLRTNEKQSFGDKIWSYILWLTIMLGFWATMSLSIADITRYAATQREQVAGQFLGLPGTMMLYSFVAIFVTCAAIVNFDDVLVGNDAPWDPVSLLAKFDNPLVVVISQIFMIIATLSTNIAANVIAPANAFSNLLPKKISFRMGGIITGIIGIIICPWFLMDEISNILIFVSGLLGPVLGIMLSDYYWLRKKEMAIAELYKSEGAYSYAGGINMAAMIALVAGVGIALIGYFVPALEPLYKLSWFTGFAVSFFLYYFLMKRRPAQN
jgi:cytosine/uracil/thiamine/allantoin permease